MKKCIKIVAIVSIAILLIAWVALTIALFVTLDINDDALLDLRTELQSTKSQMEKYKKELDAYNPTTADTFANTKELMNAIKHNPSHYNGKAVVVEGIVEKRDNEITLWTYKQSSLKYERSQAPSIIIIISDPLQQSVLEWGDYIKLQGTVTISNGEVYLDNCTYTMIQTSNEQ